MAAIFVLRHRAELAEKMESESDEDEIFRFSAPKLVSTPTKRPKSDECNSNNDSSFVLDSDSDEDEPSGSNRRRKAPTMGGSKAANLLRKLKKDTSSSGEDGSPQKSEKRLSNPRQGYHNVSIVSVIDSDDEGIRSRSPSPPPPAAHTTASSLVKQSSALIASLRQNRRVQDTPVSACDLTEDTPPSDSKARPMRLRVRISKKTHRITVQMTEPFLEITERLAALLQVDSSRILLTHKTQTIRPSDTPSQLGIDTTDFIDGVVMEESINAAPNPLGDDEGGILVKVQSQKDSEMYRIAKGDPLGKIMGLFASKLGVPVDQIKFSFDGDRVKAEQTAEGLGLDDEDALDARIT